MLLSAYWRRRCPPQLSYHPRCPHPRNSRNHPSCPTTSDTCWWSSDSEWDVSVCSNDGCELSSYARRLSDRRDVSDVTERARLVTWRRLDGAHAPNLFLAVHSSFRQTGKCVATGPHERDSASFYTFLLPHAVAVAQKYCGILHKSVWCYNQWFIHFLKHWRERTVGCQYKVQRTENRTENEGSQPRPLKELLLFWHSWSKFPLSDVTCYIGIAILRSLGSLDLLACAQGNSTSFPQRGKWAVIYGLHVVKAWCGRLGRWYVCTLHRSCIMCRDSLPLVHAKQLPLLRL